MGEIRRVRDVSLNRDLAMKILHPSLVAHDVAVNRFLEEAQATAQLQHPSIVPVHDIGTLPDGRLWFTMKEVRGQTLDAVVRQVHAASDGHWRPTADGWTFKRLVAAFLQVCHAMAYAHERGVLHRDLKPQNVMVGSLGQTYVLDWGLAKVLGASQDHKPPHPNAPGSTEAPVVSARPTAHQTRLGSIAGTPAYMAPEQARGETDQIDARTDVYALGSILYEILTGEAPYDDDDSYEVLARVLAGPPPAVRSTRRLLPPELVATCERAMAREQADRFASAHDLAAEIEAWLDGARKREQALQITERALTAVDDASALIARADALEAEGDTLLAALDTWQPEEDKTPGWAKQDAAAALRQEAERKQLAVDQGLHGALRVAPDLPEAHAALAERYRARHAQAESQRHPDAVARAQTLVQFHADALPDDHPTRQQCLTYLKGDGALSLVTDPPGAEVTLYRYTLRNRRRVEVPVRSLGTTPLRAVTLPMGSYLCVLDHPDCDPVRYPAEVPRLGHWDGVAPGDTAPTPVWLPPTGTLGPDEVYVPAGWFRSGGDPHAPNSHPDQRLWCDPLVMHRFPITNRQYLAFLNDLVARGRTEEALHHAPRERAGSAKEPGALIYGFDGDRFSLRADADGDIWRPDWPVIQVDWHGAVAWLEWLADRTGRPWRLPGELEWEKAARGVDGRWYPWGDHCDPSWCCMTDSHPAERLPTEVDRFPVDTSPYGLRGMAGNVEDACLGLFAAPPPVIDRRVVQPENTLSRHPRALHVARGGMWHGSTQNARIAYRYGGEPMVRVSGLGFRGVFSPRHEHDPGAAE